jgi:putative phosphoribosyl transferase
VFADRCDAGRQLAMLLTEYSDRDDVVVVGLPRGGVPVAREVATFLAAPLDVVGVRKLGLPSHPELAMGAVGEGGVRVLDKLLIDRIGVSPEQIAEAESRELRTLRPRVDLFRDGRPQQALADRFVLVVDDGIATGSTARAACEVIRCSAPRRIVLAVPAAPADWSIRLASAADEFVAVQTSDRFRAVGDFYADFSPTTDAEVIACLRSVAEQESARRQRCSRRWTRPPS